MEILLKPLLYSTGPPTSIQWELDGRLPHDHTKALVERRLRYSLAKNLAWFCICEGMWGSFTKFEGDRLINELKEFPEEMVVRIINIVFRDQILLKKVERCGPQLQFSKEFYLKIIEHFHDLVTYQHLIKYYNGLGYNDYDKVSLAPVIISKIDFDKYPGLVAEVKNAFEGAFEVIKDMKAAEDGWIDSVDGPYVISREEREEEVKKRELQVVYWPLVRSYVQAFAELQRDACLAFLIRLFSSWRPMYIRHHAFLHFSKLTTDVKYAKLVAKAIPNEPELDTRTPMLEWLASVDYDEVPEVVSDVLLIAERLSENPCLVSVESGLIQGQPSVDKFGNDARLYIGNDDAIPDVKKAASALAGKLRQLQV